MFSCSKTYLSWYLWIFQLQFYWYEIIEPEKIQIQLISLFIFLLSLSFIENDQSWYQNSPKTFPILLIGKNSDVSSVGSIWDWIFIQDISLLCYCLCKRKRNMLRLEISKYYMEQLWLGWCRLCHIESGLMISFILLMDIRS